MHTKTFRTLLLCISATTLISVSLAGEIPLSSLHELQRGDFTEMTTYWYTEDGKLTCPRLAGKSTTTYRIKRVRRDKGVTYFDCAESSYLGYSGKTLTLPKLLATVDGRTMKIWKESALYLREGSWGPYDTGRIIKSLKSTDSIVSVSGEGDRQKIHHTFAITWGDVKKIVSEANYDEIKKRVGSCTDCTLAMSVKQSEDFFGIAYDTTGILIFRRGYWWSPGTEREFGWIEFIRPIGETSGQFYMSRIRIITDSRLGGGKY